MTSKLEIADEGIQATSSLPPKIILNPRRKIEADQVIYRFIVSLVAITAADHAPEF